MHFLRTHDFKYSGPKLSHAEAKRKKQKNKELSKPPVKTYNLNQQKGKIIWFYRFKGHIASIIQFRPAYALTS